MGHLTDDGLLTVSRWYFRDRPAEMYRTTSIAVEALKAIGVNDPRRHIVIVRNMRPANAWPPDTPDGVGTILVSRRPFTDGELDTLARDAARLEFDVPFSPRVAHDETFTRLTEPTGLRAFLDSYPVNIAPSTDDSPFFFNMLRLKDIGRTSLFDFGNLSHNMKAVATLGMLLVTVTGLTAFCILLPLWLTRDRVQLAGTGPLFLFFIAIGLGFMLIETSQMQRLILALGHPTYGLSVVLFALLLSSGIGSYLTAGVSEGSSGGGRSPPSAGSRRGAGGIRADHAVRHSLEPADDDARQGARGRPAAVSSRGDDGDGFPTRNEGRLGQGTCADAVALGAQRRGIGARISARGMHRPDLVHLGGILDRMALLSGRVVCLSQGRAHAHQRRHGVTARRDQTLEAIPKRLCKSFSPQSARSSQRKTRSSASSAHSAVKALWRILRGSRPRC